MKKSIATRSRTLLSVLLLSAGTASAQYDSIQRNIASHVQQNQIQSNINAMRDLEYQRMRSQLQSQMQSPRDQPSFAPPKSGYGPQYFSELRLSAEQIRLQRLGEKFNTSGGTALELTDVGMQLLLGVELNRDEALGIESLGMAADPEGLNWHYAQYLLGDLYLKGKLIRGDAKRAIEWFTLAAENRNIRAQAFLTGSYLFGGEGVAVDTVQALHFAELLERSLQAAPVNITPKTLGVIRESGLSFESEEQKREAAMLIAYAEIQSKRKSRRSRVWLERAVEWGCKDCIPYLALLHFDALNRNEQDEAAAFRYAERAANLGYKEGDFLLCRAYLQGVGTARDPRTGLGYCSKATNEGIAAANREVGNALIETGEFDLAIEYFDKGIAGGDTESRTSKALAILDGRNPGRNVRSGVALLEQAAPGSAPAAYALGAMYDAGDGVAEDTKLAVKWMESAAERGHILAQSRLAIWSTQGGRYPADPQRAKYWVSRLEQQGVSLDLSAFTVQARPAGDYRLALPLHNVELAIPKEMGTWRAESLLVGGRQLQTMRLMSSTAQNVIVLDVRGSGRCFDLMYQNRMQFNYEVLEIPMHVDWYPTGLKLDRDMTMFCRDLKGAGMLSITLGHIGGDGATAFSQTYPLLEMVAVALLKK